MGWSVTEFENQTGDGDRAPRHVLTRDGRPLWVSDEFGVWANRVNEDRVPATWEPKDLKGKLTNGKIRFWNPMWISAVYLTNGLRSFPPNFGGEQDFIGFAQVYEDFTPVENKVPVEVSPNVFAFRRKTTYGTVAFLPSGGLGAVYRGTNMKGPLKAAYFSDPSFFGRYHYADANVRSVLVDLGVKEVAR